MPNRHLVVVVVDFCPIYLYIRVPWNAIDCCTVLYLKHTQVPQARAHNLYAELLYKLCVTHSAHMSESSLMLPEDEWQRRIKKMVLHTFHWRTKNLRVYHLVHATDFQTPVGRSTPSKHHTRFATSFSALLKNNTTVSNLWTLEKISRYASICFLSSASFPVARTARKVSRIEISNEGSNDVLHNAGI